MDLDQDLDTEDLDLIPGGNLDLDLIVGDFDLGLCVRDRLGGAKSQRAKSLMDTLLQVVATVVQTIIVTNRGMAWSRSHKHKTSKPSTISSHLIETVMVILMLH